MAVFKCKMCGGTIEFENGATVGVCDSCGTKQTLPRLDDEKRARLYDRANHFRRENEFDKAMGAYEMILADADDDAEAYWGIVLCRYGIEYVEDSKSHKRIPTVNRTQYTSIFDDRDYQSAIQYADGYQKSIYEEEAKAIDTIQKGILEISSKEDPFDIFICYKETDTSGERTQDSVYAQEIYSALKKEGYNVFFSRITLEDKLGQQYEPYIFAALHSAKIMLVVGSSRDNFNAPWVKNEWSRFIALAKEDSSKTVIPCYKDISPYDMPEDFTYLQSQDIGKIGYIQDIIHGIEKLIKRESPAIEAPISTAGASTESLLKRAFLFLEDGDWESADKYCERVLDIDPENGEAYLGKLMADANAGTTDALVNSDIILDNNGYFLKALKYSDKKRSKQLETISEANKTKKYESACRLEEEGKYNRAIEVFEHISSFKDSVNKKEECLDQIGNIKSKVKYRLELIRERQELLQRINREKAGIETNNGIIAQAEQESANISGIKRIVTGSVICATIVIIIDVILFGFICSLLLDFDITSDESDAIVLGTFMILVIKVCANLVLSPFWKKVRLADNPTLNEGSGDLRLWLLILFPLAAYIMFFADIIKINNKIKNNNAENYKNEVLNLNNQLADSRDFFVRSLKTNQTKTDEVDNYLANIDPDTLLYVKKELFDDFMGGPGFDELLPQTVGILFVEQNVSTTIIQRKLDISQSRVIKLIDELTERQFIDGHTDSANARKILVGKDQWVKINKLGSEIGYSFDAVYKKDEVKAKKEPTVKKTETVKPTVNHQTVNKPNLYINRLVKRPMGEGKTRLYIDGKKYDVNTDINQKLTLPLGVHTVQFRRGSATSDILKLPFNSFDDSFSVGFKPAVFTIKIILIKEEE
ncbi:MAG: TIR domain-containing protein [Clostridiales bacterium]|nr:TIR domain-containing protein [Clostridiales bacterium]